MIRLRTLGSIGLSDGAGEELAPVLRRPKRFALLTYLVLARPRGFQRRDSLLALFWPDLDDERARASLRQSLYTLRRELPRGVLRNRGDGEVGVAADRVWSDVRAFEEAVDGDAPEEALALYRGELLSGFHFGDASPEFGYWLDAERARLHELALEAGREACARAEAADDLDAAVRWATRVAELAPLDEQPVRKQMELLHRRGDRSGALLAFDGWSRRLQEQLEIQPSPAMAEFAEGLRTSTAPIRKPRTPRKRRLPEPHDPAPAPAPRRRRSRRRWRIGAAFVAVLAVIATLLPLRLGWRDGTAAPAAGRVIVLPFSYRGGGDAGYLSEGLVYLFSVALDGESLRAADPHSVVRRTKENGREEYDAGAASDLADGFDARHFLLGSAVEAAGRLRVTAALYERGVSEPLTSATAAGTTGEVLDLVDQVAAELLTAISERAGSRVTRIASVTTQSLPALKAYLKGERLLGEGRFDEAIVAFETAATADTLFALAHYRASVAASWAFRGELATRAAARAVRHADRLPERERRLLAAHEAYRRGEAGEAADRLRQLTALYPEDPETWYRLGEVILHLGPVRGWSLDEAREPFLRAVELDPARTDAYYHLTQIAAAAQDTAAALEYVRRALDAAPTGSRAPQLRMMETFLQGVPGRGAGSRRLAGAGDFTVVSSVYNLAVYLGRPDLAREVAALLVDEERPLDTRVFGHLLLADLELALGRRTAAGAELDRLERIDPRSALQYRALLALAPGGLLDPAEMADLLRRLDNLGLAAGEVEIPRPWKPDDRYKPLPLLYARGTLAAALGRTTVVDRTLAEVAAIDSVAAADLAVDFRLLDDHDGQPETAEPLPPPAFAAPGERMVLSPMLSRSARRYAEGRRLERLGRLQDALQWYESLATYSVHDLPWAVPALLDRARIHQSLGDPATAATLYRRFARLQRYADDPTLRDSARASATRLVRHRP